MHFTQGVGGNEQEYAGSLLTGRLMTIIAKGLEEYENVSGVFFRFLSPPPCLSVSSVEDLLSTEHTVFPHRERFICLDIPRQVSKHTLPFIFRYFAIYVDILF